MNPKEVIHKSWFPMMETLLNQPALQELNTKILPNISFQPKKDDIFNVFRMPLDEIKVVILGQDPYPTPGDAIGYAFLKAKDKRTPKSLQIISKEILASDYDNCSWQLENGNKHVGILSHRWSEQGVFLLNTALTVETSGAGSHLEYWKNFTAAVIWHISVNHPCIWVLWGKKAQWFQPCIGMNPFNVKGYDNETIEEIPINDDYNYVMTAPHPAAEAYSGGKSGFYGCNHFYFVNKILAKQGKPCITW